MKKRKYSQAVVPILILILIVPIIVFQRKSNLAEQKERKSNLGVTVGQVIKYNSGKRASFTYQYFEKGKRYFNKISGHNLKIRMNEFFDVEFSRNNPSNSELLVKGRKYNPLKLINDGEFIGGVVRRTSILDEFVDLYIEYKYFNIVYSFRTRLHKDNLPCGTFNECQYENKIKLKVYKDYPMINDLYFKSHDRQMKNKKASKIDVILSNI